MKNIKKKRMIAVTCVSIMAIIIISAFLYLKHGNQVSQEDNEWTITQYSSPSDYQAMFYTIKDKNNRLTVIDGGYREDADYVEGILAAEGGVVDNWIITHPHPDHVGAFNYICEHYSDEIKINHIYAIDMDYDSYKEKAETWDGFYEFESFLSMTENMTNIIYVHDGDEFDIDGLKAKVLSAYSDKIKELSDDLANDGSMMFKLTGNEESILYCADVGYQISDKIINEYKDLLKSNYIQMGHHGNGGLTAEFYEYVSPKGAFFDAPEWLMKNINPDTGKEGKWNTLENIELMESMGAVIYGYPTAPNTIILK
ncbi:MAG: ComEC/Rec2 family competence protein [Lachnotalea sp.]